MINRIRKQRHLQSVPITINVVRSHPAQALATRRWFSSDTPVYSTNKTDRHDITEILLKVAFNTITLTRKQSL